MVGCNCCIAGATTTPDITDPCVCNSGKGAVFVGAGGAVFVRVRLSNPCAASDWDALSVMVADFIGDYAPAAACVLPGRLLGNDSLSYDWGDIAAYVKADEVSGGSIAGGANGGVGVTTDHALTQISIINPDGCKALTCLVVAGYNIVLNGVTANSQIQVEADLAQDAVFASNPGICESDADGAGRQSFTLYVVAAIVIAAGATSLVQIVGRSVMTTGGFTSSIWYPHLAYIGVSS